MEPGSIFIFRQIEHVTPIEQQRENKLGLEAVLNLPPFTAGISWIRGAAYFCCIRTGLNDT